MTEHPISVMEAPEDKSDPHGPRHFNIPILSNISAIFSFWDEIDKDANTKRICYNGADENHPDY